MHVYPCLKWFSVTVPWLSAVWRQGNTDAILVCSFKGEINLDVSWFCAWTSIGFHLTCQGIYFWLMDCHRCWRDEVRCSKKYGADWDRYKYLGTNSWWIKRVQRMFSFTSLDMFRCSCMVARKKLTEAGCAILHFPRHLVSAWQLKQQSLQQKELCLEWPKGAISFEPQ